MWKTVMQIPSERAPPVERGLRAVHMIGVDARTGRETAEPQEEPRQ